MNGSSVRAVPWGPVGGLATGALVVMLATAAAPSASLLLTLGTRLGLALVAASAAYVMDEAAAAAVDSTPWSRRHRAIVRLLAASLPLTVGVVGLLAICWSHGGASFQGLLMILIGCVCAAVAAAAAARRITPTPGDLAAGAVAGAITFLSVYNPVQRWVDVLPVAAESRWSGTVLVWLAVTATSAAVLAWATRDPLSSRPRPAGLRLRSD